MVITSTSAKYLQTVFSLLFGNTFKTQLSKMLKSKTVTYACISDHF